MSEHITGKHLLFNIFSFIPGEINSIDLWNLIDEITKDMLNRAPGVRFEPSLKDKFALYFATTFHTVFKYSKTNKTLRVAEPADEFIKDVKQVNWGFNPEKIKLLRESIEAVLKKHKMIYQEG